MKKSAQYQFAAPAQAIFPAIVDGLPAQSFTIEAADPATGRIWAETGVTLFSWGTRFEIDVVATGPSSTNVDVRSKTKHPLQWTDWGKTKKDFRKIHDLAQAAAGGPPPQQA